MTYFPRRYRRPASAATLARRAAKAASARAEFLAANPGLEDALKTDHGIVRDVNERLTRYGSVSDKTVALVFKLAKEANERAEARASETHVAAPTGRTTFTGTVVSAKWKDSRFGYTAKMTVKVTDENGATWLAWGTVPATLVPVGGDLSSLRGGTVTLTGTLSHGNDTFFAFFKRPTLVSFEAAPEAASEKEAA